MTALQTLAEQYANALGNEAIEMPFTTAKRAYLDGASKVLEHEAVRELRALVATVVAGDPDVTDDEANELGRRFERALAAFDAFAGGAK